MYLLSDLSEGVMHVGARVHLIALLAERDLQSFGDDGIIFHQENLHLYTLFSDFFDQSILRFLMVTHRGEQQKRSHAYDHRQEDDPDRHPEDKVSEPAGNDLM